MRRCACGQPAIEAWHHRRGGKSFMCETHGIDGIAAEAVKKAPVGYEHVVRRLARLVVLASVRIEPLH